MPLQCLSTLTLLTGFSCVVVRPVVAQDPVTPPPSRKENEDKQKKQEADDAPEVIVIGRVEQEGVPKVPLGSVGSRDVMDPEQVRRTGSRDLNDLVNNLPAISARPYNGGEAAAPSFSMRGLPDDGLTEYVYVGIDGINASALPYGWTAFSFMPITTERVYAIDYIRGAHTLRYSPNTVAGILNFITRPIPEEPMLGMRSTFGSFGYSSQMVYAGGTSGRVGALVTYVDRRGDGYRADGGFDQQDFNVKLAIDQGGGDYVETSVSYMHDDHQAPGGLTQAQYAMDRFGNARPNNHFSGFRTAADLVWHEDLGNGGGWIEPFASFSETGRNLRSQRPQFGTPTTLVDWDDESFVVQMGVRGQQVIELFGAPHTLYGGVRYERDWIPSWKLSNEPYPGGPGTLTQDAEYSLDAISFHLDDTFEPVENLVINGGARVEWIPQTSGEDRLGSFMPFDDDYFTILPGIGASYLVTDEWAFFANYYEGFRSPQVWGYAFVPPGGQANLVFEEGLSTEAGTRIEGIAGFYGSVALWRTEYEDFGSFYTGFYENLGHIVADGVDFVLEFEAGEVVSELDGLVLSAALTLQDSTLKSGPNAGNEVPYAWEKKANWRASYETDDHWNFSFGGVYVGPSFSDEANTTAESADGTIGLNPSWTLWDAQIAKELELGDQADLEVAVGATNLFDADWFVHSRGGSFGGGKVAGPPRQAYVAVNLVVTW